jgi:hypothetical protein
VAVNGARGAIEVVLFDFFGPLVVYEADRPP